MPALAAVIMENEIALSQGPPTENISLQKEVDRILLRLRQSKAFQRAVGHTMGNGGYGSIRLDISHGKIKRIISEAIYLEND